MKKSLLVVAFLGTSLLAVVPQAYAHGDDDFGAAALGFALGALIGPPPAVVYSPPPPVLYAPPPRVVVPAPRVYEYDYYYSPPPVRYYERRGERHRYHREREWRHRWRRDDD